MHAPQVLGVKRDRMVMIAQAFERRQFLKGPLAGDPDYPNIHNQRRDVSPDGPRSATQQLSGSVVFRPEPLIWEF